MAFTAFDPGISLSLDVTLSNSNLTLTYSSTNTGGATCSHAKTHGKFYVEFDCTLMNSASGVGILVNTNSASQINTTPVSFNYNGLNSNAFGGAILFETGSIFVNGTSKTGTGSTLSGGHIGCLAIDLDNKQFWARTDGGNWNGSGTANPATNTGGYDISGFVPGAGVYLCAFVSANGDNLTLNAGASAFSFTAPSGFGGWTNTNDSVILIDVGSEYAAEETSSGQSTQIVDAFSNGTDRIMMLHIYNENSTGTLRTVSSVSGASLTWALHKAITWTDSGGNHNDLEIWWAHAPTALSGSAITVTLSGTTDAFDTFIYAVSGASTSSPFDTNGSIPGSATDVTGSATTGQVTGLTTTSSTPLVVAAWGNATGGTNTTVSQEAGYALLSQTANHSNPSKWGQMMNEAQVPGAALSSTTVSSTPTHANWGMIVTALSPTVPTSAAITTTLKSPTQTFEALENPHVAITTTLKSITQTNDVIVHDPPFIDPTFGELTAHGFSLTSPATSTFSGTNKTAGANELMVFAIAYNIRSGGAGSVASVSVSGLTFSHQYSVVNTTSGQEDFTIEVWTAPASSAFNSGGSNLTYTIDWTSGPEIDNYCSVLFAIENVNSVTTPFDTNAQASGFNTSNTTPPVIPYSTIEVNDLLISLSGNGNPFGAPPSGSPVAPTGWTQIASENENNGIQGCILGVNTRTVSAPQSTTFQDAQTDTGSSWTGMVLAFTANTPSIGTAITTKLPNITQLMMDNEPPNGVWASTDNTDVMVDYGFTPTALLPPDLDGTGGVNANETNDVLTVDITTLDSNDIVVLNIFNDEGSALQTVASITDENGLLWQKYTRYQATGSNFTFSNQEIWWAYAPTPLSADTITINFTGEYGAAAVVALAAHGVDLGAPFDGAPTLPVTNFFNGTLSEEATVTFTTASKSALLLGFYGSFYAYSTSLDDPTPSAPSPWEVYNFDGPGGGGSNHAYSAIVYNAVSDGADGVTAAISCLASSWGMIGTGLVPPQINFDGYGSGGSFTSPADQVTITTFADDVLILFVYGVGSNPAVTSITDTEGLTWARRSKKIQATTYYYQPDTEIIPDGSDPPNSGTYEPTGNFVSLEIWWAKSNGHATTTITVDFVNAPLTINLKAVSVNGLNTLSPWDTNESLPAIAAGNAAFSGDYGEVSDNFGVGNSGIFTTAQQTLSFSVAASPGTFNWGGSLNPALYAGTDGAKWGYDFWTYWFQQTAGMPLEFSGLAPNGSGNITPTLCYEDSIFTQFQINTSPLSGEEVGWGGPFNGAQYQGIAGPPAVGWIAITDALVSGGGSGAVFGEFNTGENVDRFVAAGYESTTGVWASTEAKDVFSALGFTGPILGTMAPTEHRDLFRGGPQPTNKIKFFVS